MFTIELEYPVQSAPRYGYGKPRHERLAKLLDENRSRYGQMLAHCSTYIPAFRSIALHENSLSPQDPYWLNDFLPGLDIVALYSFVARLNPDWYVEVGSGNSTKVVRKAITDQHLRTRIISIDPFPRAEIDAICDYPMRQPLESLEDLSLFEALSENDIVFVDNSHRVFMNSDVSAFFLDVLPRLKPGVIVQIHDIFLPDDYPPQWINRYYSEQYMLACCLLAEGSHYEILMPNHFIFADSEFQKSVLSFWEQVGASGIALHGGSFWMRKK